ncbi:adenosylhomocysteine nucleosidase [Catenuloplanes nepalensis]|uniref:Adenosylhomocysteine nucleosidase n=2 Tax=Catenuloplanes nepalensis TaxID=587533 RepID=A0ABT9MPB7_9ACTN|nr:adenosylhomocysteine nucleosidase [Catenuloplanes nepalensis]
MAIDLEAEHLGTDLPVLFTGMGKVNAAVSVAAALASGPRPSEIINLGTAGALRGGLSGTHVAGTVIQHDFDEETLFRLTGVLSSPPLTVGAEDAVTLATGDSFIADDAVRARLAERAALVDMEGYAVAAAARAAGVPVRLVKHVSDEAGAGADRTWKESVADCSRALGDWLARQAL